MESEKNINVAMAKLKKALEETTDPNIAYDIWNFAMGLSSKAYDKKENLGPAREVELPKPVLLSEPKAKIMPEAIERIGQVLCPGCSKPVGQFRDEDGRNEYKISGMCQVCQDAVFG